MLGLDEAIEKTAEVRPLPVVIAPEPAPPQRRFRVYVPRIVDYMIVATVIYFLF